MIFIGCSMGDLMMGQTTLLVGIEDEPGGVLRAYVGARYRNLYIDVTEPTDQQTFRDAWGSGVKVLLPLPSDDLIKQASASAAGDA